MPAWFAQNLAYICGVAIAWTLLYAINDYFFNFSLYNNAANLIFLPAMLRPVAVLLFGPAGVIGLFIGSLISFNLGPALPPVIFAAALASASSGWLAISLMRFVPAFSVELSGELSGFRLSTLVLVCGLTAGFSAFNHQLVYALTGVTSAPLAQTVAMFTGDALGSLIMLYALTGVLRLARSAVEGSDS